MERADEWQQQRPVAIKRLGELNGELVRRGRGVGVAEARAQKPRQRFAQRATLSDGFGRDCAKQLEQLLSYRAVRRQRHMAPHRRENQLQALRAAAACFIELVAVAK